MGCDKTLTKEDRIVQYNNAECFGPFFGLQLRGQKGLPDLVIHHPYHTPPDHLDIDEKRDELYIFRPGISAPIGVTFEHSLRTGKYAGTEPSLDGFLLPRFSIEQVERAKKGILAGRLQAFHFIADGPFRISMGWSAFPDDVSQAIQAANATLTANYLAAVSEPPFSMDQMRRVEHVIRDGRMQDFLFVPNATLANQDFPDFPEALLRTLERANSAMIAEGKEQHLISYHSIDYRQKIPVKVWTPSERQGPPFQEVHYPRRYPGVDPQWGH